jgi:hypothetical protein
MSPGLDLDFERPFCHPARNIFAGVIDAGSYRVKS